MVLILYGVSQLSNLRRKGYDRAFSSSRKSYIVYFTEWMLSSSMLMVNDTHLDFSFLESQNIIVFLITYVFSFGVLQVHTF
jgi:hypothetical protein